MNLPQINKILITRTDKLGDVILTLPLISEVSRIFPEVKIHFLVRKYVKDLMEGYPPVDSLIFLEDFKNNSELIHFFKREKYDVVINVFPGFELAYSLFRAGINIRIGTGYRWFSFLYNKKLFQHRKNAEKHESEYNIDLLKLITNRARYSTNFFFSYSGYEKNKLLEKLTSEGINLSENYIIVHPGSKGSAKDWSYDNFCTYINYFLEEFNDTNVILTGTEEEQKIISGIISSVKQNNRIINLAGKLNLRELMIVIDNSKLFISNSTGPIHIAGALNKNIIGFYPNKAPMNAIRWRPLSENAVILSPFDLSDNMDDIKPENVISETKKFM